MGRRMGAEACEVELADLLDLDKLDDAFVLLLTAGQQEAMHCHPALFAPGISQLLDEHHLQQPAVAFWSSEGCRCVRESAPGLFVEVSRKMDSSASTPSLSAASSHESQPAERGTLNLDI